MRIPGHALIIIPSGERSLAERSSTGECKCGWTESASTRAEVRFEYRMHLRAVHERGVRAALELAAATETEKS